MSTLSTLAPPAPSHSDLIVRPPSATASETSSSAGGATSASRSRSARGTSVISAGSRAWRYKPSQTCPTR